MKIYGINLAEGTDVVNLTIDSGTAFPDNPSVGELFYRTDIGLHVYTGAAWESLNLSDLDISKANLAIVQKTPRIGEFSTVTAAVSHVNANSPSATNPWVVLVHPGIYSEPAVISIPQFTTIIGVASPSCIIQPAVATNDIFLIAGSGIRLEKLTIRNATGLNAAGVRITAALTPVNLNTLSITGCYENLVLESSATLIQAITQFVRLGAGTSTKNLARVQSNAGQLTQLRTFVSNFAGTSGATFTNGVFVTGAGALCEFNGTAIDGVASTGNGIVVENGANISGFAGVTVNGFNRNIVANNVGAAPEIKLALSQSLQSGTYDLFIDHPGTTGFFSGVADQTKIYIDPAATMSMLFNRSGADSGVTIVGDLNMGPTFATATQVTDLIIETPPMGLMFGGEVTRVSGLIVNVAAGNGYVRKNDIVTRVEWESGQVTLEASTIRYISIDGNGVLSVTETEPSYVTSIVLAQVETDVDDVVSIRKVFIDIKSYGNHLDEYLRKVIGPVFLSGSIVSENATTSRALDVTAGLWNYGTLTRAPQAVIATPFFDVHRNAQGAVITSLTTVIDNATIDTATGLAPITPSYFTKHTLYTANDGIDLKFVLQHGSTGYATLEEAQVAPLPPLLLATKDDLPPIASIVTQQGNANIVEINDIRPRVGASGEGGVGLGGGTLVHGELIGLTFDDHPQYLRADGARALTDNLNLGANDVVNVGLVDGIDPSAHGARHLPTGPDPIPVAAQAANTVLAGPITGSSVPSYRALVAADIPVHDQAWSMVTGTPTTITGYGITDAFPAFTGDITKPVNSTITTLSLTGIASGTYKSLTIDLKGRALAGSNPTTLTGYGITDAVPLSYLAVSNGVATLDAGGRLTESQIPTSLTGAVYQGTWNAATNTPTITSSVGTRGYFYIVSVAGTTNINGITSWSVGDQIIFNGTVWQRIVGTPATVTSVAGRTGAVTLTAADVSGVAVDSAVVHLSGAETITGAKTFSSLITGDISGNAATVTTIPNLTGDVTSIGTATSLPSVGTPGTYRSVTTDAKGRVISGSNPTTIAGYGITDAFPAFSGDVIKDANSNITYLSIVATPGTYQSVTVDEHGRVLSGFNPTTLAGYGITDAVRASQLGVPSGVATLNSAGKVLASQLPTSVNLYQGTWDASTNTPTIISGQGTAGNYYNVSVAGSVNIDGTSTWNIGDQIIFNGTVWQRVPSAAAVSSVAGRTGDIVLTKADITDLTNKVISGTTDQIVVTNGAGDAPVVGIATNPVIPGTGSLTLPRGGSGSRPTSPANGMVRFNSMITRFEGYDGAWKSFATENFVTGGFQPLNTKLTSLSGLTASGFAVNVGGAIVARTFVAGSGMVIDNADGANGDPIFSFTGSIGTIEGLATTGLLAKTGSTTWETRSLVGVANQVAVTNANGVDGDVNIGIANDPIVPGVGSMTIPRGTTAQRSIGPAAGSMRFNTDINKFEFYQSGQWTAALNSAGAGVVPAQMTQLLSGPVPAISGTASIPLNNAIPAITNGALLFQRSITMSAPATRIMLSFPYWIDVGSPNTTVITQVFRYPFTGYQFVNVGGNKTSSSATNLVETTTYTATITIDDIAHPISILGSNASTYETLKNMLQNAIGEGGTAAIIGGNLRIASATSSTTSTVAIEAGTLFAAPLNGFTGLGTPVSGATPGCLVSLPSTIGNVGRGNAASVSIVDIPGTGTFTYTVNVGSSSGATWYINSSSNGNNFGGFNTTSYSIMEIA